MRLALVRAIVDAFYDARDLVEDFAMVPDLGLRVDAFSMRADCNTPWVGPRVMLNACYRVHLVTDLTTSKTRLAHEHKGMLLHASGRPCLEFQPIVSTSQDLADTNLNNL